MATAAHTPPPRLSGLLDDVRQELAARDRELRDALVRLADLYQDLFDAQAEHLRRPGLRSLARAVETLAGAVEASSERVGETTRAVSDLADALRAVSGRVDGLSHRLDAVEAGLDRLDRRERAAPVLSPAAVA